MIQSMTGFGSAEANSFKVEIKSLNHRYMDISIRMPSALMEHDIPLRKILRDRFERGKFDVNVSVTDKSKISVNINRELAKGIYSAFSDLREELKVPGPLTMDLFSGFRELLMSEDTDYDTGSLYQAFETALDHVEEMRKTEGEALVKELLRLIGTIAGLRSEIEVLAGKTTAVRMETLSKKIYGLLAGAPLDETRLAQEAAFMAQKSDITEELARLDSHVNQFPALLEKDGAIGRRLDFILQEINREVNTIASKMDDVRIIGLSIEMKTELEKLREQAQNIQ